MDIKFKDLYLNSVVARYNHGVLVQNTFSQAPEKHLTTIIICKLNFLEIVFQKSILLACQASKSVFTRSILKKKTPNLNKTIK